MSGGGGIIRKGDVCVWQNVKGRNAWLNGNECTALTNLVPLRSELSGVVKMAYQTDTQCTGLRGLFGGTFAALPHELRRKGPPREGEEIDEEETLGEEA